MGESSRRRGRATPAGDQTSEEVHVAAGVIWNDDGRVLIACRPAGRPLAGRWEFPGGKVATGETALEALSRELREEIGIEVLEAEPLIRYRHAYPGRVVVLDVWRVARFAGEPRALEGQPLRWELPERLLDAGLLEADRPIVDALLGERR
jgi:8-oxo-dGTP diphosphatase